jgi:hypothetical protein
MTEAAIHPEKETEMTERKRDLRDCLTAYVCRERLPELSAWMSADALKLLTIWKGTRFERGRVYFDLDNPDRGPFVASGDEGVPSDYTYVCESDVPAEIWAQLITWRQPVDASQGDALQHQAEHFSLRR